MFGMENGDDTLLFRPYNSQCLLFHWPRLLQLNVHQFVRMLMDSMCICCTRYALIALTVFFSFSLEHIPFFFFATLNPVDLCCYAITIFSVNVVQLLLLLLPPLLLWVFSIFLQFLSLILLLLPYSVYRWTNI